MHLLPNVHKSYFYPKFHVITHKNLVQDAKKPNREQKFHRHADSKSLGFVIVLKKRNTCLKGNEKRLFFFV